VLILGAGWVGSRLAQSLLSSHTSVVVSNRPGTDVQAKPPYFRPVELSCDTDGVECPPVTRLDFDLTQSPTWSNLPPPESLSAAVVTFPVTDNVESFWDEYLSRVPHVVCYSTTSVYQVDEPGQLVDETTLLRQTQRIEAERFLQQRGATILTLAGIFGPERTPRAICTW
jgi:nucleoside-diphosphate-sugar epimerase